MRTAGMEVLNYPHSITLQTTSIQVLLPLIQRINTVPLPCKRTSHGEQAAQVHLGNSLGTIVDPFLGIGSAMRPKIDHTRALSTVITENFARMCKVCLRLPRRLRWPLER